MKSKTYGTITPTVSSSSSSSDPPRSCRTSRNMNEEAGRAQNDQRHHQREHGLTITSAAIFVAAEMAGSGILTLPRAIIDSGWIGFFLTILFCLNAAYGGSRLGDCWALIEDRYPEYREITRNPYPVIAVKAVGFWGRYLVSGCLQFTLFGAGTVYLLLASRIIQDLLKDFVPEIGFCIWFLIFAACLCIPMWLGSPKDFWIIGIVALLTTALSCTLIFIQIILDGTHLKQPPTYVEHSYQDLFIAFGTILFSFGGASTFPTIQNDMIDRKDFHKSVRIAFAIICALYLPIAVAAYFVYGESVQPNVIMSLTPSPLTYFANLFMACHLILAFIIIINPVSQDIEEIFQVPKMFCFKRCLVRTLILCLMVFIGETIPKFDKILSLVGGSTVTLATFVLPPLFYMVLCDQISSHWPPKHIPLYMRCYMWELIIIGIVGGLTSTYSAIREIVNDPISKPCYWPK